MKLPPAKISLVLMLVGLSELLSAMQSSPIYTVLWAIMGMLSQTIIDYAWWD